MKTAFGSVLYGQAWEWKSEFIDSINRQTSINFDVLLINDGISDKQVRDLCAHIKRKVIVFDAIPGMTISEIRIELIRKTKLCGYDLLIFGDFDDTFSERRVEKIQGAYHKNIAFYYHGITCGENVVFKDVPKTVISVSQIEESNFLGLSNTAINLCMISNNFLDTLSDVKTNVFDWYFYAMLLSQTKATGIYVPEIYTCYRQHSNNIAGAGQKSFAREIEVKLTQYRLLSKYYKKAEYLLEKYSELASSEAILEHCISKATVGYWWSLLKISRDGGEWNV